MPLRLEPDDEGMPAIRAFEYVVVTRVAGGHDQQNGRASRLSRHFLVLLLAGRLGPGNRPAGVDRALGRLLVRQRRAFLGVMALPGYVALPGFETGLGRMSSVRSLIPRDMQPGAPHCR